MDLDIDETAKGTPFLQNAAFYHSRSSSPSVIIKPVCVFEGGRQTRKACRCNIGGCAWKRQVYLLRTCHALHSPLGSRLSPRTQCVRRNVAVGSRLLFSDTIKNGKAVKKGQCIESAMNALKDGKSVFIDRCNVEKEQRDDFVKLGGSSQVDVHAVVLDLLAKLCILWYVKRTGHEGKVEGGKAVAIVNRMLQKKELPVSEGFARITFCQSESDVQSSVDVYSGLGPLDTLPNGYFGQKNPGAKIQLGIMKFLKKTDGRANTESTSKSVPDSNASQITKEKETSLKGTRSLSEKSGKESKVGEELGVGSVGGDGSLNDASALAFPSVSTADFQFHLAKASDIIVEKVIEFRNKLGNSRHILSLVRAKALAKSIDSNKFFTFVGDITRLHAFRRRFNNGGFVPCILLIP
ncbi:hypothetical protein ACFX10_009946 [Malus domestica]